MRNRIFAAGLAGLALVASIPLLPQHYLERMGTITKYQSDESASTRLQVWQWTLEYAAANPMGGGFDAFLGNKFTYETRQVSGSENNRTVTYEKVTDSGRAYHSSYFEMLGEQGWPGLFLWLSLQALGVWQMERIRWRFARKNSEGEEGKASWQWGFATALQQSQIVYLVGAAFVGIAYQPFIFMLIGLQCGLWSYVKRTTRTEVKARFRRPESEKALPAAG